MALPMPLPALAAPVPGAAAAVLAGAWPPPKVAVMVAVTPLPSMLKVAATPVGSAPGQVMTSSFGLHTSQVTVVTTKPGGMAAGVHTAWSPVQVSVTMYFASQELVGQAAGRTVS